MSLSSQPVPVRAYAYATTFRLKELAALFAGAEVRIDQDEMIALWPDGSAALTFDFGAVVFFGTPEKVRDQVVEGLARKHPTEPHPPLTEDFLVEIRPGAAPEAYFERVVVPELGPKVIAIVGLLLAQSAALDYYDEDVTEVLSQSGKITQDLAMKGRLRGRVKDLIRFIGSCMQTKDAIIQALALFDKPDATWEDENLDKLYIRLREQLEIGDRYRALEYKLRMIQDNLVLLVDMSRQRHALFLEWSIVILILVEVGVTFWQLGGGKVAGH